MSGVGRTQTASVHKLRRSARRHERELQALLKTLAIVPAAEQKHARKVFEIPDWARGARVEKAGRFQHAVVFTEERGT